MQETTHQNKGWVYGAALLFALNGGLINGVSILSFLKHPVGYVTGNLTFLGMGVGAGAFQTAIGIFLLVASFLLGSMISGFFIREAHYQKDYRYDIVLAIQCVTVLIALALLKHGSILSGYFLALTMGLQNAMTTHYGSALVRTTHMTGTMTDLGLAISHRLKGYNVPAWKILLYIMLIIGFTLGATASVVLFARLGVWALGISAMFYASFCLVNLVGHCRKGG